MIRFRWRSHPDEGQIAAFADDELSGAERAWVIGHLAGCEKCRGELRAFESMKRMLETCLGECPEPLLESAKQALLRANLDCPLDGRTRSVLFGNADAPVSCKMVEEIVGQASAPG